MRLRPVPSVSPAFASVLTAWILLAVPGPTARLTAAASGGGDRLSVTVPFGAGERDWPLAGPAATASLTAEPGDPRVPFRDVALLLPPDSQVASASFIPQGERVVALQVSPAIAPSLRTSQGEEVVWGRLDAAAPSYPDRWGELLGTSIWHGFRVATVRLYAWRLERAAPGSAWSAARGAGAIAVDLMLAPADETVRRRRPVPAEESQVRERLARSVLNPELLAGYPAAGSAWPPAEGLDATWAPNLLGANIDYVIVTSAALATEFQRLADYKTARGIPTIVESIEGIAASHPSGADLPQILRGHFAEAYRDWGTRAVLLGGDTPLIPTRKVLNTLYPAGEGTELPVDLYYACLDGDWNADGDELMGEPYLSTYDRGDNADLAAELWVGRAPVNNAAEAAVFVDKVIAYEQEAAGEASGRVLFLSEVLFPSSWTPSVTIQEDGASYSEAIIDSVLVAAADSPTVARMYEAAALWPGAAPESRAAAIDSLNSGRYGLVNHVGHGFFYNMSVGDATLELKDAAALHNGPDYFVLNSLNCSSSAFDYNCILERFLLNPAGGAVATVGSARAAFPVTASLYQRQFYRELYLNAAPSLGAAMAASRAPFDGLTATNTPERWTHMTMTLLGDPMLAVWTSAPAALTVAAPDSLPLGEQQLTVVVEAGGAPLPGARVCLLKAGEDYVYATTNAAGQAQLALTVKSPGEVTLNVTATNCLPLTRAVPVVTAPRPYLKIVSIVFRDDGTLGSHGNGDGVPNAGETVAVAATFANSGSGAASGPATAYAYTTTPWLQLLASGAALPPLGPGETGTGDSPWLLEVGSEAGDQSPFTLEIFVLDGDRVYRDEITAQILAPELQPSVMSWVDYPGGDGDGNLDAGENLTLSFTLLNIGSGRASGLTATVEPGVGLTVVDGTAAGADIPPLEERGLMDPLVVRASAPVASAKGTLVVSDAYGHTWRHRFDLIVPAQPVMTDISSPASGECLLLWTPNTEADLYGYHIYRSLSPNSGFARLTSVPLTGGSLYRDTGLQPLTQYFYRVAAADSSRLLSRASLTGSISTMPAEQSGFPIELDAETSSHCAVGDVNGDGRQDVVLAADYLYVWDADGVELRDGDGDSQTLGPFNSVKADWGPSGVALANLTNRPGLEIVAANRTSRQIWVYQGDGSVAPGWPRSMSAWNWAAPAVGDLDGDGDLEIVVNTVDGRTYVWHHDGSDFLDGDHNAATIGVFQVRTGEAYSFCSPALVDLDGDGAQEIILGTRYYDTQIDVLMALRADGTNLPGWPVSMGQYGEIMCSPAVGDLDGDGLLETVVVSENDRLHVVGADGRERAPFPIVFVSNNAAAGVSCPSPALADFDGDGKLEIVAVSVADAYTSSLHVIRLDGSEQPGWPRALPGNSESSPVVGDITGDGLPDVLFGIGGGADSSPNALYAFRDSGGTVPGFPLQLSGPIRPTPFLTDLNGDGDLDIVYGGWDLRMHVWDLAVPYAPERLPWPTFKGNPLRTGLYAQTYVTAVPDDGPALPPPRARLDPNFPNPFNPRTRIAFAVPGGGPRDVRLTVYDLRGRRVARLVEGELPPGRHTVDWEGRDDSGRPLASGAYLYRLTVGGEVLQRRMTLVR